jgi:hypothetical protein
MARENGEDFNSLIEYPHSPRAMHRLVRVARLPRVLAVRSVAGVLLVALPATARAQLPAQQTSVVGGSGGTTFTRDCGAGRVLTGLRGREGLQIDAVAIMCAPVLSNGTLGPTSAVGTLAGGGGGTFKEVRCALVLLSTTFR